MICFDALSWKLGGRNAFSIFRKWENTQTLNFKRKQSHKLYYLVLLFSVALLIHLSACEWQAVRARAPSHQSPGEVTQSPKKPSWAKQITGRSPLVDESRLYAEKVCNSPSRWKRWTLPEALISILQIHIKILETWDKDQLLRPPTSNNADTFNYDNLHRRWNCVNEDYLKTINWRDKKGGDVFAINNIKKRWLLLLRAFHKWEWSRNFNWRQ